MSENNHPKKKEDIDVMAYYISEKNYSYDELCWMLAEKLLMEDRLPSEFSDDALKFFINWIVSMIDLGGPNLPKTISSQLGAKLGQVYKSRGITSIEEGLIKSYEAIQGKTEVIRIDEHTIEVKTEYMRNFCPIGGSHQPSKAKIIQESLCHPFTISFLNALNPEYNYQGDIHECIVATGDCVCRYTLHLEKKNNSG